MKAHGFTIILQFHSRNGLRRVTDYRSHGVYFSLATFSIMSHRKSVGVSRRGRGEGGGGGDGEKRGQVRLSGFRMEWNSRSAISQSHSAFALFVCKKEKGE